MSATKTRPKKATPKKTVTSEPTVEAIIERMDALLPKWKLYETDRKAKVAREKRRGRKEHEEFEVLYRTLRKRGLKLADARKQADTKK
jgi:hypothetical protein